MKELQTFRGDHFVLHISKHYERNTDKLKDYDYDLIFSSPFVHAPLNKDELKGLADFIYKAIEQQNNI